MTEKDYVTPAEALKILSISRATLRRWQDSGALTVIQEDEGGLRHFLRHEVEALAKKRAENEDDETSEPPPELVNQMLKDNPGDIPRAVMANAMVSLVNASMAHANQSAKLYFQPAEKVVERLMAINEAQATRIRELEANYFELFKAKEEALSERTERELAAAEFSSKAENRRKMLDNAMKLAPLVVTAIAQQTGANPILIKLSNFLSVLDPAKLQLLMAPEMGILDDNERTALGSVLEAAGVELPKETDNVVEEKEE